MKELIKKTVKNTIACYIILVSTILLAIISCGIIYIVKQQRIIPTSSLETNNVSEIASENANIENVNKVEELTNKEQKDTKKEKKKESEDTKKKEQVTVDSHKYYIKVNYGAQTVTVYKKDSKGKFTIPVKAMICSTGTFTPTSGTYRTLAKGNWWPLYGDVYGQYATHIYDGILFHSVPYLRSGDRSSLEYWAYDRLGERVSMGCVRLTVADAKWIYENCTIGTQVEFYSSSNPGPLGKPSAAKISDAPENVRGWDPTDPNPSNPWPKYLKEKQEQADKNNEIANEIANEITGEISNETTNQISNEVTNEISNEVTNEIANEITNGTTNEITNEIGNETAGGMENEISNAVSSGESNNNQTQNDTTNEITNGTISGNIEVATP